MSKELPKPTTVEDLTEWVKCNDKVLPVGNRTKAPLTRDPDCSLVSLSDLSGMIEYEPSEFTFTAWAGSRVSEIEGELNQRGQYLPFDPVLLHAGATLGGTIASGLSGPGRFRFGGVRDFLIGIQWLDGQGRLIRGGGKVVKNAAGFDFPKFMVGSLGRYGILVEVTFKVFPKPMGTLTWGVPFSDHAAAMNAIADIASSRLEVDALDYRPDRCQLAIRLAGPSEVLPDLLGELRDRYPDGQRWDESEAHAYWNAVKEFQWSDFKKPTMVKVPMNLSSFLKLEGELLDNAACRVHLSVGGNIAWVAVDHASDLDWLSDLLLAQGLSGLVVSSGLAGSSDLGRDEVVSDQDGHLGVSSGVVEQWRIGHWPRSQMQQAVKAAMDPLSKFPGV